MNRMGHRYNASAIRVAFSFTCQLLTRSHVIAYEIRQAPDLTPSSDDPFAIHLFNMSLFVANCGFFLPEGNIEPLISGNTMERERLSILNRVSLATRNLLECHDLLENL